jgi:hypothetical protein
MAEADRPHLTPFERFEEATKRLFQVSKKDVDKAELRAKKEKEAREGDQPSA